MKFLKIKLKNFRPYYEKQGKTPEIFLFDESKNQNITLNIGQNGYGKTSISEALLWCIFGDEFAPDWDKKYLNTLSKRISKEKNENTVNLSVELLLELRGKHYRLIRTGDYDIRNNQKIGKSKLSILHEGDLIDQIAFVANYFPAVRLMEYFVFDADDILKKFESNRAGTIEEHINNFAGVKRLDDLIKSLNMALDLYDEEKRKKESAIHGNIADIIKTLNRSLFDKKEATAHLKEEIKGLEEEKTNLFKSGSPDMVVINFSELIERRNALQKEIQDLNP